jgi:O-succinylbenzoic acid--CoA ligase
VIVAPDWLEWRATTTPRAPALHAEGETLGWGRLAARVRARTRALRELGVQRGEVVATLLANGSAFVELAHAVPGCGAVLLPLHVRLHVRELAALLRDAGARWLVHGPGELAGAGGQAARGLFGLRVAPADALRGGPGDEPGPAARAVRPEPEATCAILYTSGTSGPAKGVELTRANFFWSAVGAALHLGAPPDERWLACLPLFHVGGLAILMRSVLLGNAVVVHERFDAARVSRSIDEDGITAVSLVPTMLSRLLEVRGTRPPPSRLRCVLLGGGPIPGALVARAWRSGWPVAPSYGLTEAASQVATLPLAELGARPDVAGRPLPVSEVAVAAPSGETLGPGEPGEILVRGPTVMARYRGLPDVSERTLRGGWLHTGDVGCLDRDGLLRVLERRTDLIVTGGENVYPAEVENALAEHPSVQEAGVAAEADPEFGQRVVAWVVLRPGARATGEGLQAFCRTRLAGYKIPRAIHFVDSLPRTASGKLVRRVLGAG